MSKKTTDIVSYITLIGWLIAFLAGDKENSKFHLNQSLVIMLINLVISVADWILGKIIIVGTIFGIFATIAHIVLFVFLIMGIVSAVQGTEKPLPIIGGITLLK